MQRVLSEHIHTNPENRVPWVFYPYLRRKDEHVLTESYTAVKRYFYLALVEQPLVILDFIGWPGVGYPEGNDFTDISVLISLQLW